MLQCEFIIKRVKLIVLLTFLTGYVEVPRDEDSEDDSDDEENKAGDGETTEGIIAKAKEEAKTVDEEEAKVIFLVLSFIEFLHECS